MSKYRIKKHCHVSPIYDFYTIERKWLCFWLKVDELDEYNSDFESTDIWFSFEEADLALNKILGKQETHIEIIKTENI